VSFEAAQAVADAVLYEGYVLYPYRASSAKNRVRWQFGVVVPRRWAEGGGSEPWASQTECLVEPAATTTLHVRVRFLQAQARTVEEAVGAGGDAFRTVESLDVDGRRVATWDEGVERCVDGAGLALAGLLAAEHTLPIAVPGGREAELLRGAGGAVAGRVVRERWPIAGVVRVSAAPAGRLVRLRVRVENLSAWPPDGGAGGAGGDAAASRDVALRRSLLGAHTLLAVDGGAFVSLLDPPPWAAEAAAACANAHTWPVLVGREGERSVVLSSPIILYDHPAVAPESPGDLFDATEIDEILTLRVMTLTDEEKREARGTDERARRIVERSDTIPPEIFERMHGAIRSLTTSREEEHDDTT
jgi:hypothetical protein